MKYLGRFLLLFLAARSVTLATVHGQDVPPGDQRPKATDTRNPSNNASSADPTSADRVIVESVLPVDRVSPLERPISSVYGTDLSILDTPRTVTAINSAQQRDLSIEQVTDLLKLVPDSYTNSQFGGANIPFIRGQAAEVFQNGMLRTPRSDGQPLSFNSVEAFDVVAGPASVVYGPTGNVGGYVNLVTKRPFYDGYHGFVSTTIGEYNLRRWQADIGGPITKELAWRVSYQGEDSGSYYRLQGTESQDVYAAVSWTPTDKFRVDFNAEFFEADYDENTGINRPTQDLIDNGRYIQGTGVSPFSAPGAADPRGFLSVITPTGVTTINRRDGLFSPQDGDYGKNIQGQLDVTYTASEHLSVLNKTYFEDYQQDQVEISQRYYNDIDESYNFEDRLEFHLNFDTPVGTKRLAKIDGKDAKGGADDKAAPKDVQLSSLTLKSEINTGLSFRYIHVLAFQDFYNEYLNATDISTNPANYPITTNLFGVLPVPGDSREFATPGGSYASGLYPNSIQGTQDSNGYQFGLFYQHNLKITDQWSLLFGGRGDLIYEDITDPLPPPGFKAVSDSTLVGLGAANASVTYKPTAWNTDYFTFNYNESAVNGNGGGFASLSGNQLIPENFHIQNYLFEGGAKFGLFKNSLFASFAAFYQQRATTNQFGVTNEVDTRGLEFQANYQPNKNFYGTFSASYLDAFEPDVTGETLSTRSVYDAFAPPTGTGVGSPNFLSLSDQAKTYRLPAVPRFLLNAFAKYRFDWGGGLSAGVVATSPIPLTEFGDVVIPWQYTVNAAVFYEAKRFEARVDFSNLTNQKNWTPSTPLFGAELVNANLPFQVYGSIRIKF